MSQSIGFDAEEKARHYLTEQGLTWVKSNYSCRMGEIDLIMRDHDYLVFIEVRARSRNTFGNAMESVTPSKQRKLHKTAAYYLQTFKLHETYPCRFDIVSFDGVPPEISWLKNAFEQGR